MTCYFVKEFLSFMLFEVLDRPPVASVSILLSLGTGLTLLPKGGGGGGLSGPHHQTGSQNSRTLSPRVSKISDFFFMPFRHIVAKFQAD